MTRQVGTRRADGTPLDTYKPGDFGRDEEFGDWWCKTPNGYMGRLSNHEVTEHTDGTITVHPSIKISDDTGELWHGWLQQGVWRGV